jgi:hypothetical protein
MTPTSEVTRPRTPAHRSAGPGYATPVRTVLQLDNQLISDAKVLGACTRRTLNQVIEDALRQALHPEHSYADPDGAAIRDLMGILD